MNARLIVLGLVLSGFLFSCGGEEENLNQIVFMENARVFESFQMKLDYDALMERDMKAESVTLDSLGVILQSGQFNDSLEYYKVQKDYYLLEEIYTKKFEQLSTKYTNEVNERLNVYVEEYAKEKGFDLIIGSGSGGNVMYVSDDRNITDDLIEYINNKYGK